jgi:hypothetical protein
MKLFRYKFQADSGLVEGSVQEDQTMSHTSSKIDSESVVELSSISVDEDKNNQEMKSADSKGGCKRGRLLCAGGLLLVLVIGASVGGHTSVKEHSTMTSASRAFCQPSSIKDTKESMLELTLFSGMKRLANEEEAKILERAVMEGYNEASGGCTDEFERWILGTFLVRKNSSARTFHTWCRRTDPKFLNLLTKIQEQNLSINLWYHYITLIGMKMERIPRHLRKSTLTWYSFRQLSRVMLVQTMKLLLLNTLNLLETLWT